MTLLQFLAAIAAILVLLCLFLWQIGKPIDTKPEDGQ